MILEPGIVLIMNSLQLADMQVPLALQLLQLALQVNFLFLERRLSQPQYLVLLIPVLYGNRLRVGLHEHGLVIQRLLIALVVVVIRATAIVVVSIFDNINMIQIMFVYFLEKNLGIFCR